MVKRAIALAKTHRPAKRQKHQTLDFNMLLSAGMIERLMDRLSLHGLTALMGTCRTWSRWIRYNPRIWRPYINAAASDFDRPISAKHTFEYFRKLCTRRPSLIHTSHVRGSLANVQSTWKRLTFHASLREGMYVARDHHFYLLSSTLGPVGEYAGVSVEDSAIQRRSRSCVVSNRFLVPFVTPQANASEFVMSVASFGDTTETAEIYHLAVLPRSVFDCLGKIDAVAGDHEAYFVFRVRPTLPMVPSEPVGVFGTYVPILVAAFNPTAARVSFTFLMPKTRLDHPPKMTQDSLSVQSISPGGQLVAGRHLVTVENHNNGDVRFYTFEKPSTSHRIDTPAVQITTVVVSNHSIGSRLVDADAREKSVYVLSADAVHLFLVDSNGQLARIKAFSLVPTPQSTRAFTNRLENNISFELIRIMSRKQGGGVELLGRSRAGRPCLHRWIVDGRLESGVCKKRRFQRERKRIAVVEDCKSAPRSQRHVTTVRAIVGQRATRYEYVSM